MVVVKDSAALARYCLMVELCAHAVLAMQALVASDLPAVVEEHDLARADPRGDAQSRHDRGFGFADMPRVRGMPRQVVRFDVILCR